MIINEHFILIDSRLRDTSKYITPAQYMFELSSPLHNVKSIQLVHAIYSKNDSNIEKYAYLCIKEVPSKQFVPLTRSVINDDVFTYLPFHKQDPDITEYEFTSKTLKAIYTFDHPLPSLTNLSIALIDKDGRLFPIQEHTLCFMVTTVQHTSSDLSDNTTNPNLNIKKTPYEIMGLTQGSFSLDILVERFKQKANTLRYSGNYSHEEYDELKQAFKKLANTFKKDTT
jgi:hypothetical protein